MLNRNEFRMGNLIKYQDRLCKIEGLQDILVKLSFIGGAPGNTVVHFIYWAKEEQLAPVPITSEILLKCGFSAAGILRNLDRNIKIGCYENAMHIVNIGNSMSTSGTHVENIKYLHQLQNLYFVLTGEELNCNL